MNDRQQIVRDHAGFSAAAIPGWLPLVLLPLVGFLVGYREPPWVLMWLVALAMFFGCKWLTWSQRPQPDTGFTRSMMFLFLWPGMDARAFCGSRHPGPVRFRSWVEAFAVTCLGVCLLWGVARWIPNPVLSGWVGLWGAVLLLHFGSFK